MANKELNYTPAQSCARDHVEEQKQLVDQQVWTPAQFCERYHISMSTFKKMLRDGRGPKIIHIMSCIRIPVASESEWLARMEAESNTAAARLERARRNNRLAQLAKLAVQSPKHPRFRGKGQIDKGARPGRRKRATA